MRLINADLLIKYKVSGVIGNLSGDFVPGFAIAQAPTIDAVPVVRCKDCANKQKCGDVLVCMMTGKVVLPDFFCNFGAKMDGGEPDEEK